MRLQDDYEEIRVFEVPLWPDIQTNRFPDPINLEEESKK
jgi:hypothetical protein